MEKFLLNLLKGTFANAVSGLSLGEMQQNAFNQRMAEDAFNRQIDYYEKFQSPQSMVQQYQAAGINPALVAGYSPSTPPSSQAASGSGGNAAMSALNMAMQYQLQSKQLEIQRDLADAEIENKNASTRNLDASTTRIDIGNTFAVALESANLNKVLEEINLTKQKVSESQSQVELNGVLMDKADAEANLHWLEVIFADETFESRKDLSYWTAESVRADAQFKTEKANRAAEYVSKEISLMAAEAFFKVQSGKELAAQLEQYYNIPRDEEGNRIGFSVFEQLNNKQLEQLKEVTANAKKMGSLYDAQKHYYDILSEVTDPATAAHWASRLVDIADAVGKFYVAYSIGGKNIEITKGMRTPRTVVKGFQRAGGTR